MSSKLALAQLKSLTNDSSLHERPSADKELRKTIRKKRRSARKQSQRQQQQQQQQKDSKQTKLDYYKATTSTQKSTAEIMSKLLGQPVPQDDSDSDLDLDFGF